MRHIRVRHLKRNKKTINFSQRCTMNETRSPTPLVANPRPVQRHSPPLMRCSGVKPLPYSSELGWTFSFVIHVRPM
jgi:hypothetical protein